MITLSSSRFVAACLATTATLATACSTTSGTTEDGGPPAIPAANIPGDSSNDGGRAGDADAGGGGSTGSSLDGALTIVSLTSTLKGLTQTSLPTTFIAIVTASSGLETIAGGQLMDDQGATYAAFGAGANKGTFAATLDWRMSNAVAPINVPPAGGKRMFVAKFFDNSGRTATATVELQFNCKKEWLTNTPSTYGAHDGNCVDFSARATCDGSAECTGTQSCVIGQGCKLGSERCFNGFKPFYLDESYFTCGEYCIAKGGTCAAVYVGCEGYNGDTTRGSYGCTELLAKISMYSRCVCH